MEIICPKCNKEAPWVENKEKYGRNFGKSFMCYFCKPCGTYVGCHENTRRPLGTMADKELMEWRMKAHRIIDPLWKGGQYKRKSVYIRLNEAFGEEIHIGSADIENCKQIINTIPLIFQRKIETKQPQLLETKAIF